MQKRVLFILFSCMFLLIGCGKESSVSIQGWEPLEKEPVIETPQQETTVSPTIYANITPILQNKKELVQKWAEKKEAEIFCQNFANEIYEAKQMTINQNAYSILVCINGFYDAENCKDLWKNHAKQTAEFVSLHQKIDASMDGYATEHVGYWKCLSNDYYSVYSYYHPDYPQLVIQIKGITNTKATKEDALQMWDMITEIAKVLSIYEEEDQIE